MSLTKKAHYTVFLTTGILVFALGYLPGCLNEENNSPLLSQSAMESESAAGSLDGSRSERVGIATPEESRGLLLLSFHEKVVLPTYVSFHAAVLELEQNVSAYASSLLPEEKTSAQEAWKVAIAIWQRAEVFQVGPAAVSESTPGGENFRDLIYSWPLINGCRVDQETLEGAYEDWPTFQSEPVNVQGLDALEKLLFDENLENECALLASINKTGEWAALSESEITQKRADYASALTQILIAQSEALQKSWEEDFAPQLIHPGAGSLFADSQASLDAISDSLFYFDKVTKDVKIAVPAGVKDCTEESCPDQAESLYAGESLVFIRENVAGLEAVLWGGTPDDLEAYGWLDLLTALGAEDLANQLLDKIDGIVDALDSMDGDSLPGALANGKESSVVLHTRVVALTDLLKGPFLSTLNLEIPASAATDND